MSRDDPTLPASRRSLGIALRWAREVAGLTQAELGARLGVREHALGRRERGEASITRATVSQWADACEVSEEMILRVAGAQDTEQTPSPGPDQPQPVRVPSGQMLGARELSMPLDEDAWGTSERTRMTTEKDAVVVRMPDDSMQPHVRAGDIVTVAREPAESGDLALVEFAERARGCALRRFFRQEDGSVHLMAEDSRWVDEIILETEQVRAVWRVVAVTRLV